MANPLMILSRGSIIKNGEIITYELDIDKNHTVKLFITFKNGKVLEPKIMAYVGYNSYNGFNKWEYKIPYYIEQIGIAYHSVKWYKTSKTKKKKQKGTKNEFDWMN